ncbi:branched-chain amino acid ABC transporter ATP-binding protein/permease [Arthrobacter sp. 24S4-2]|uniref:branched-chain amino acid ABC transporter ATP-binding protein/permease n=1 Tax=Arthrobacter sp. 24S4-2 TaxID=2575374 RepID=UPI0010C7C78A|nr:ATP-binding cassette domain-containing protein [Arthrobacter sp. 24S4-2]QCO98115.1 branched-chain amino acid ABC transporter ATP-binding protein/permease [Arthrobacter sp. 24S4-2]
MQLARNAVSSRPGTALAIGAAALVAGWLVSMLLPGYLVYLATTAIVATISLIGLGVVTGTAGMIVLCQLTFAAVGAWIVSWLNVVGAPGGLLVWVVAGGIVAGVAGTIIGLPALRLRGVNLAVVTLGFAAAADLTLMKTQFPGAVSGTKIQRPELFSTDRSYFFLTIIVLVALALAVFFLQKSRWGSSWRAVAFSERGTASAGSSVRIAKLTAFAASSAIAGIAGGLMAGQVSTAFPSGFTTLQSLALYVLSIVAGAHLIEMALFGGILWVLIPELLKRWGIPQDWGLVVFGAMGIQALTSNSNLGQDIRNALLRRKQGRSDPATAVLPSLLEETPEAPFHAAVEGKVLLKVENLTVQFGQIKALHNVNMTVSEGTIVGLIGPNGAGKSTFVDAVSGFLPQHAGEVWLGEDRLNDLAPHHRARTGLRRTFQQDRVPPSLTVYEYMKFITRGQSSRDEITGLLDFFGCPGPGEKISNVDVGTRRIIEVAANIAARPRLLVLDEPAAGLSHQEHIAFGQRLRQVPQRYGTAILIIEHDLDLVRSVCQYITVLDFGEVLASGEQEEVLSDPKVLKAYMGETELI